MKKKIYLRPVVQAQLNPEPYLPIPLPLHSKPPSLLTGSAANGLRRPSCDPFSKNGSAPRWLLNTLEIKSKLTVRPPVTGLPFRPARSLPSTRQGPRLRPPGLPAAGPSASFVLQPFLQLITRAVAQMSPRLALSEPSTLGSSPKPRLRHLLLGAVWFSKEHLTMSTNLVLFMFHFPSQHSSSQRQGFVFTVLSQHRE